MNKFNFDEVTIDKEAKEYAFNNSEDNQEYKNDYLGFMAGAEWNEWMKQQMIEGSVEGEVHKYGKFSYIKEKNSKSLTELLAKFNDGDKVKIIIVKEK